MQSTRLTKKIFSGEKLPLQLQISLKEISRCIVYNIVQSFNVHYLTNKFPSASSRFCIKYLYLGLTFG